MANNDLPSAGLFISNAIKSEFNAAFKQLIADIGRDVTVHLPPYDISCVNCKWDYINKRSANIYTPNASGDLLNKPFVRGQVCPVCGGRGRLYFQRDTVIKCLINKRITSEDNNRYSFSVRGIDPTTVVRLKATAIHKNEFAECVTATIDGSKYEKISEPITTGLDDLSLMIIFFKRAI